MFTITFRRKGIDVVRVCFNRTEAMEKIGEMQDLGEWSVVGFSFEPAAAPILNRELIDLQNEMIVG